MCGVVIRISIQNTLSDLVTYIWGKLTTVPSRAKQEAKASTNEAAKVWA
jgi:hypothetical protein